MTVSKTYTYTRSKFSREYIQILFNSNIFCTFWITPPRNSFLNVPLVIESNKSRSEVRTDYSRISKGRYSLNKFEKFLKNWKCFQKVVLDQVSTSFNSVTRIHNVSMNFNEPCIVLKRLHSSSTDLSMILTNINETARHLNESGKS